MSADRGTFGEVLRRLRSGAALSQEALAERAGLSKRGISDLERGARLAPRLETVRLLADALASVKPTGRRCWPRHGPRRQPQVPRRTCYFTAASAATSPYAPDRPRERGGGHLRSPPTAGCAAGDPHRTRGNGQDPPSVSRRR